MANDYKQISDLTPKEGDLLDSYWIEVEDLVDGVSKRQNGAQIRAVEKKERIAEDKKIVLKVGLNENSPYNLPNLSGTNHIAGARSVMDAVIILDNAIQDEEDPIAMEAIGDRQYTEQNHITSGDSITKSLDDLDKVVDEFTGNTEELPSQEIILTTEEIPDLGKQITLQETTTEESITFTFGLDESKVRHNNLLEFDPSRHRKLDYNNELEFYLIED